MIKVEEIKEVKTLQVTIATGIGGVAADGNSEKPTVVTFRFSDDKPASAEVSSDGVNWYSVAILHKAIGAFVDRYPLEFAE